MISDPVKLIADAGKITILYHGEAADPNRGRRRMYRIAVEFDREQPRQGPQETVEL